MPLPQSGSLDKVRGFIRACKKNELNKVSTLLLSLDADVNWKNDDDAWSGLHIAARDNYGELLELRPT